jgi:oligopeptide/dipeptide ABC transporter ATP-binding protein
MREVKGLLARIDRPARTRGKSLYHRIAGRVTPGSASAGSLAACREACGRLDHAHEEVQRQLEEVLALHTDLDAEARTKRAVEVLEAVGIPDAAARIRNYPHQFSGGMRQRVMIAMALLCHPELLIADEPTTALDVTIQAQILDLLNALRKEQGTSIILITHDLGVVAGMSDRIIVMYAGRVMEQAPTTALFRAPSHPYTVGLLRSLPRLDDDGREPLVAIPGQPPVMSGAIVGCPFAPRCAHADDRCRREQPMLTPVGEGHTVACHYPGVATGSPTEAA